MKDLDKKSNNELQGLKQQLALDFEIVRKELAQKTAHWDAIEKAYIDVVNELKRRGVQ